MGTTAVETTPQSGSLEDAGRAIAGLLSTQAEDKQPPTTTQTEPSSEPTTKQSPPAPVTGSEEVTSTDTEGVPLTPTEIRKLKVKLPEGEQDLPEDEVVKGYLRNADYTRKQQALADEKRKFEAEEVAAARAHREQYSTYLTELKTAIERATPKEPDWTKLRAEVSPDVFAAELLHWQQTQKELTRIDEEKTKVEQVKAADAEQGFKSYVTEQAQRLAIELPEMADPVKGKALKTKLWDFAKERGFTDDVLNQVTDHRLVLLLHDAFQFREAKAKAPAIENKIANAIEASAPGSRTTTPKTSDLTAAQARLEQTHTVEDGGRAIAALLRARKAP